MKNISFFKAGSFVAIYNFFVFVENKINYNYKKLTKQN